MKKLILILLLFPYFATAQFSFKTEYDYIKFINIQGNQKLIKNNIKSALVVVDSLLIGKKHSKIALYLNELSTSFYKTDAPEKALYVALMQRVLYTNDSLENSTKFSFFDKALRSDLSQEKATNYWSKTERKNLPTTLEAKKILLLEMAVKLYKKALQIPIKDYAGILKNKNFKLPLWYDDWESLTQIKSKESIKKEVLNFNKTTAETVFEISEGKAKRKIYIKTIRFYTKINALTEAKTLLKEYKHLKLPFFKRFAIPYKKIRILLKAI